MSSVRETLEEWGAALFGGQVTRGSCFYERRFLLGTMGQSWFSNRRLENAAEKAVSKEKPTAVLTSGAAGPGQRSWIDQVFEVERKRPNVTGLALSTNRWLDLSGSNATEWVGADGNRYRAAWIPVTPSTQVRTAEGPTRVIGAKFRAIAISLLADK